MQQITCGEIPDRTIVLDFKNIDKEISKLWRLENISKPLKGISAYKIGELRKIYKTLFQSKSNDLQTMKSTKKILYNLIKQKIE